VRSCLETSFCLSDLVLPRLLCLRCPGEVRSTGFIPFFCFLRNVYFPVSGEIILSCCTAPFVGTSPYFAQPHDVCSRLSTLGSHVETSGVLLKLWCHRDKVKVLFPCVRGNYFELLHSTFRRNVPVFAQPHDVCSRLSTLGTHVETSGVAAQNSGVTEIKVEVIDLRCLGDQIFGEYF